MTSPHVAAFDVDGTLTTRDCVVPFLRRVAGLPTLAWGVATAAPTSVPALVRRDRDTLKAVATRTTFRRREAAVVAGLAAEFAADVADRWLRDDTVADLRRHQADGAATVLVSASYAVYLRPLAAELGVDEVLATELDVGPDGRLTGSLQGNNCRGPEKVRRLHTWLGDRYGGRSAVTVTAYGDSAGDRELLADADEAHWVVG
ncbi:MAG: HAD-IB family hydrolase [Actinomycetota bacterium]